MVSNVSEEVIVTTTDYVPGYRIVKVLGVVSASGVWARHIGRDIVASLRNIVGGEIREYTDLLRRAREEVIRRLKEEAKKLGANAVICVRFSTSGVMQRAAEVMAYGTAVVIERE